MEKTIFCVWVTKRLNCHSDLSIDKQSTVNEQCVVIETIFRTLQQAPGPGEVRMVRRARMANTTLLILYKHF